MKACRLKIGVLCGVPVSLLLPQVVLAESAGGVGGGQFWIGIAAVIITIFLAFNKLSDRVSKIEGKIEVILKGINISLTQSNSPLSLSEEGEKVLVESGGKEYIEKESSRLIAALAEKVGDDFSNPFDVQEKAKEVIGDLVTKTGEMPDIKHYLYKHSRQADDIVVVMGLALRDRALQEKAVEG